MLTEAQEAWLKALESGEFEQTQSALQYKGGYCCLGVACVVAEKAGVPVVRDRSELAGGSLCSQPGVRGWLKLRSGWGVSKDADSSLVGMNDQGKTFKEIAAAVRANPEEFFAD